MVVVIIGQLFVAVFGTIGANLGSRAHVGFPVQNRLSWGMRANVCAKSFRTIAFHYSLLIACWQWFPIMNRTVLGMAWFAVESWYGGVVIKVCHIHHGDKL